MKIIFNNNIVPRQGIYESAISYRGRVKKAWKKVGKVYLAPQAGFIFLHPKKEEENE